MAKVKGKVTRSFYYYDLNLLKYGDNGKLVSFKNQENEYYKAFSHILKFQNEIVKGKRESKDIEMPVDSGDKIYIIVDKVEKNFPIEFRLVLCREDALPFVESQGLLKFLTEYLPKDFSLAEITHCVIFPKYNIMGAEYNYSGARATAIKFYLPKIFPEIEYVYCTNRLDDKVIDKLRKDEKFSLFVLGVRNGSDAMAELMNKRSIFALPFTNIPDVDVFEVILKRRKSRKHNGFDSPIPLDEIDGFIKKYREDIKSFKVSQRSIQRDAIDLLHDKLVKVSPMTKTVNKTIDSKEAYREIKTFFDTTVKLTIKRKIKINEKR